MRLYGNDIDDTTTAGRSRSQLDRRLEQGRVPRQRRAAEGEGRGRGPADGRHRDAGPRHRPARPRRAASGHEGRRRHQRHADAVPEEGDWPGLRPRFTERCPRRRSKSTSAAGLWPPGSFRCRSTSARGADRMYPTDRRYTKEHEWVQLSGTEATVGITDFAQKQLGDVVFVELPDVGRQVTVGEVFGTIESVKAVSELFSPVGGEVTAVNADLGPSPEKGQQRPARHVDDQVEGGRRRRHVGPARPAAVRRSHQVTGRAGARLPSFPMSVFRFDRFADRHIGPRGEERAEMLRAVGASSLDQLIDETIPRDIRLDRPLELPAARSEHEFLTELGRIAARQSRLPVVHRPRLLRLHHPAGDPAQHPREPRLVHAVHALSGRDRPGPARSAPQLPDDGARPDGDGGGQRLAPRRGHRRRRSDDDDAAGEPAAGDRQRLRRLGPRVPADARGADVARRAARHRAAPCRDRRRPAGRTRVRRLPAVSGRRRRRARHPPPGCLGTCGRRARVRGHRSPRADLDCRRPARWAPTSSSATRSGLACLSATVDRTPRSSPRARRTSARRPAVSSACPWMRSSSRRIAWPCRRASSTSAARRRRRTSAPRRRCWRTSPAHSPCITGRRVSRPSPGGSTRWPVPSRRRSPASACVK